MCVLLLRGPQTTGELRGRTERLYTFDDLEAVESTLHRLTEMEFVKQLPRQAGFKEPRWAHLLCGRCRGVEEARRRRSPRTGIASASRASKRSWPISGASSSGNLNSASALADVEAYACFCSSSAHRAYSASTADSACCIFT